MLPLPAKIRLKHSLMRDPFRKGWRPHNFFTVDAYPECAYDEENSQSWHLPNRPIRTIQSHVDGPVRHPAEYVASRVGIGRSDASGQSGGGIRIELHQWHLAAIKVSKMRILQKFQRRLLVGFERIKQAVDQRGGIRKLDWYDPPERPVRWLEQLKGQETARKIWIWRQMIQASIH